MNRWSPLIAAGFVVAGLASIAATVSATSSTPATAAQNDGARTDRRVGLDFVEREGPAVLPDNADQTQDAGDRLVKDNRLFDAKNAIQVGRSLLACTVIGPSTNGNAVVYECLNNLDLGDGRVVATGSFDGALVSQPLAIVGGTGNYMGARGVGQVTFSDDFSTASWKIDIRVLR